MATFKKYTTNPTNNGMYGNVKYEDVQEDEVLAITISPMVQYVNQKRAKERRPFEWELLIKDRPKVQMKYVKKCLYYLKGIDYRLMLEYSPLGILHYHGYIRIFNKDKFYTHDLILLKEIGHFHIKKIDDLKKWEEYINKQKLGLMIESVIGPFTKRKMLKDMEKYSGDRESLEDAVIESEDMNDPLTQYLEDDPADTGAESPESERGDEW